MSDKADIIARVIHVTKAADGTHRIVMMTGDREFELPWPESPPQPGDVYCLPDGSTPRLIARAQAGAWNMAGDAMRWRKAGPDGETRMNALWKRHTIRRAVRDYLDNQGFIEIDCPLLVRGTTPDAAINSFAVGNHYLTTSTELQMRRLQVGGFDRLYTLTQNFRRGDGEGSTHNPEFTMLEWVRVGGRLEDVEADTAQLTWEAHRALGHDKNLTWRGHTVNIEPPWERVKMADIIARLTGAPMRDFSLASIREAVLAANVSVPMGW
jgi:elongation factor P--beta-lysine ligase